jgi:BirA family transcriptional regulator, biotin operon repressor / biotin---[acetyl-CoA-carboxylase] ligase
MEAIAIASPFPGARAFLVETTASTQDEAKRLAAEGYPPGSLVAANAQSAGRGRFPGRGWESERGKNLLFTLYLGPGAPSETLPPGLPIRIGLALREAVSLYAARLGREFGSPLKLKWPNDLMIGDRKVAGILCEAGSAGVFAGLGLNCNQERFPPALEGRATSLALELGREIGRWELLELFLERLAAGLAPGQAEGAWLGVAEEALWRRGEAVAFLPGLAGRTAGSAPLLGSLEGIDAEGSILIRAEGDAEARAYPAGELTAAPPPYRV